VNSVPLCLNCAESSSVKRKPPNGDQIRTTLVGQIAEATEQVSLANQTFTDVIRKFPSGLPHPDGIQRIKNASRELEFARKQMLKAHRRLSEFLDRGIVPEDLKRVG